MINYICYKHLYIHLYIHIQYLLDCQEKKIFNRPLSSKTSISCQKNP